MARYKVLKSVAHNVGHSFTSLTNYAGGDYVMGHVLQLARNSGCDTLTIDFVKSEAGPPELLASPIFEVVARYTNWFWHLVERHGSDRSLVQTATLILRYDIATQRPHHSAPELIEISYVMCALPTRAVRNIALILMAGGTQNDLNTPRMNCVLAGSSGCSEEK
jgi:hypothetical protein